MTDTKETEYRFYPTIRTGIRPRDEFDETDDTYPVGGRSKATVSLTGESLEAETKPETASVNLRIFGPGEVTGIDERQVVKTMPKPDATDVPPNYFPFVEFDRVDFPWIFSPTRADSRGRNLPWCRLVTVERDRVDFSVMGAKTLPTLETPVSELPPPDEAWAWAHAQVIGPAGNDAEAMAADSSAELSGDSDRTVSRLLCPRNLEGTAPDSEIGRAYLAAVVPTFEVGRRAGLVEPPYGEDGTTATTKLSWADGGEGSVRLPVYYWWEFSTGPAGDFESLARELKPKVLGDDVGYRTIDASAPGPEVLKLGGEGEGKGTVGLGGALRSPGAASDPYDLDAMEELVELLNAPQYVELPADPTSPDGPKTGYGVVSPPKYGQWHAGVSKVMAQGGRTGFDPKWFDALNRNPAHRIAAGFGAEVVRENQEAFMTEAWSQFGQLQEATNIVNNANLAKVALERTFDGFERLDVSRLLRVTQPLHPHVFRPDPDGLGVTLHGRLDESILPDSLASPAFRRIVRPTGPLARRSGSRTELTRAFDSQFASGGVPTVGNRLSFTDAVPGENLPSEGDDAIPVLEFEPISGEERTLDDDVLVETFDTTETHYSTNLAFVRALRRATVAGDDQQIASLLDRPGVSGARIAGIDGDASAVVDASLRAADDRTESSSDVASESAASTYLRQAETERTMVSSAVDEALTALDEGKDRSVTLRSLERAERGLSNLLLTVADAGATVRSSAGIGGTIRGITSSSAGVWRGELLEAGSSGRTATPVERATAPDIEAWKEDVVAELDPNVRLSEVAAVRLGFDAGGDPVEEVMAEPTFDEPMYAKLAALDQEHLLPGVGNVPKNSVGLVETNPEFVEAFMVGLNHEMARELRWRRFPTDRRGTYFQSFWDYRGNPDAGTTEHSEDGSTGSEPTLKSKRDITPIHEWDTNELGKNAPNETEATAGQPDVVLLIRGELLRRYPNAIIYAAKAVGEVRTVEGEKQIVDRVPLLPNTDKYETRTASRDGKDPGAYSVRYPQFHGRLDPDITFLGFDLSTENARNEPYEGKPNPGGAQKNAGWFLVLEEQSTEPQFGLDEPTGDEVGDGGEVNVPPGFEYERDGPKENPVTAEHRNSGAETHWNALSWGHLGEGFGAGEGEYVRIAGGVPEQEMWKVIDDTETTDDGSTAEWGRNSADMARITWQRPVRIAIHADDLLPGGAQTDGGEETEDGR